MTEAVPTSNPPAVQVHLRIIPREQHNISRKNISAAALRVLYRLNEAGFAAHLVGGAVRDLLLDGRPKDFDIATNATPEDHQNKAVHAAKLREVAAAAQFGHLGILPGVGPEDSPRQRPQLAQRGSIGFSAPAFIAEIAGQQCDRDED
ncbi:MAG: hypothetical protein ACREPT_15405, partial [Rudaea sp.]